ncbi:MAG: hypothetical protein L6Q54_12855 [Leptospiraceae bacterium]|nr:hypothetical protein [Leptospiraceae bacterium]MCK6615861.1 hypothetical protein [Ignavibacteriaceae bacterium]NUN10936.1 hypothetical protein [Ignavibacteriaceae bacterium]
MLIRVLLVLIFLSSYSFCLSDSLKNTTGNDSGSPVFFHEIENQDMIISIENGHLKVILHREARAKILENEDYEYYDGAFISVIPIEGVGKGYDGTFDPEGINYIPLNKVFEGNGGEGEVMLIVDNGENNNVVKCIVDISNGKLRFTN